MEASAAPETPVNPRTRLYTIGGVVLAVLLIIGWSWYKNRHDDALLKDIQSKDKATRVQSAKTLIDQDRFVDLILAQAPDVRDASIDAALDLAAQGPDAAHEAVTALLGLSKGVDREINDPDKAVRDREGAVRKHAWKTLGKVGDVAAPQLIEALKDPSGNVRGAAVSALGMIGVPAIPGLMKLMHDRDTWDPAGDALTTIGRPALDPVLPLIDTPGTDKLARDLRLKMAGMLGGFDDQLVVPSLLRHIDDVDPGVRRQVIRTLAGLQDQRATAAVVRVMKEDPQVRLDAITALGEFHDPRAIDPLADQLKNYDYDVPAGAVAALSKIGPASLPRLLKEAKNPDTQIRTYATMGLATIGGPTTIQPLLAAARDPQATVRGAAINGMGSFTGPDVVRAVPLLITSFRDPNAEVSNGAVASLTEIGTNSANTSLSRQVVQPLIALFQKGNQPEDVYNSRVYYAERVLSQLGAPTVSPLIQALRTGSPEVKKWSALTLGDMKKDRDAVNTSVGDLRALARSSNAEESWAARDALNRLGQAT